MRVCGSRSAAQQQGRFPGISSEPSKDRRAQQGGGGRRPDSSSGAPARTKPAARPSRDGSDPICFWEHLKANQTCHKGDKCKFVHLDTRRPEDLRRYNQARADNPGRPGPDLPSKPAAPKLWGGAAKTASKGRGKGAKGAKRGGR